MSAGILFAFVGRGRTVWAEHQANMTFQNPQKTAAQMLAKLSQVSTPLPSLPFSRTSSKALAPLPPSLSPRPASSLALARFISTVSSARVPSLTSALALQPSLSLTTRTRTRKEGKYTFQLSEARTAYCLVDHLGVTFGCVASSTGMSSTSAMVFLGDLQEQFYCQFSTQEVQTCAENTTQFRRFSVTMKKAIDIAYSGGSEKISEVRPL